MSKGRRVAIVAACALAGVAVLFIVLLALVDSALVTDRVKAGVLPRIEERLGRKVTLEDARARIFPDAKVTLDGLVVHGRGDEPPFIETAGADVDLALWPLLRSLGKEIRVERLVLRQPEINLVRNADDTWNYEDITARPPPPSKREVYIDATVIEDGLVRLTDRGGSHGEATVALTDIDATLSGLGPDQPLDLRGRAAFASGTQNLSLTLTLSGLPESFGSIGPGEWPEVRGKLEVTDAHLPRLEGFLPARLAALTTGGRVDVSLNLSTERGQYVASGNARVDALQLRGEPATGRFSLAARMDPSRPKQADVRLTDIAVAGPGVELGGNAHLSTAPLRLEFALAGPLLDLDTLLDAMPEDAEREAPGGRTALLPAQLRRTIEDVKIRGSLRVERVVNGKLEASQLDAVAVLDQGVLTLERATADLYGGRIDARGTTVRLTERVPSWNLAARLEQVEVKSAMTALSGQAPLEGKLDASLNLRGRGSDWESIQKNVTGRGALALREGALTSADLGAEVASSLAEGLRRIGKTKAAATVQRGAGRTEIRDLWTGFTVEAGWLSLREPMTFITPMGAGRLDGRIGLDKSLDLTGTVVLSERFLRTTLASTGIPFEGPVSVPLRIGGSLTSPRLTGVDAARVAQSLVTGTAGKKARQVEEEVKRRARRRIGDLFERFGGGQRP